MNDSLLGDFDEDGFVYLSRSTPRSSPSSLQEDQLVKRRSRGGPAPDLASVLGVVVVILVGHDPVFIADQPERIPPWRG